MTTVSVRAGQILQGSGGARAVFSKRWQVSLTELKKVLAEGKAVSVHCRGATGRTGWIASKLLLAQGCDFQTVVEAVRAACPGAMAVEDQLEYQKG